MRIVLVAVISLMLGGCFGTAPIKIKSEPVERIPLAVPEVDPYQHREVKWIVVTPENAEEVFTRLAEKGQPVVLFALTDKGYEALALNTSDQIKMSRQMKAVIEAYKEYYLKVQKRDKKHNEKIKETKQEK